MRHVTLSVLVFSASFAHAQLEVPVKLVLTGDTPEDRQVLGLADPISGDAAVSVDALRANAVSYAEAFGTSSMVASLVPQPAQYTAGMTVTIVPNEANAASATLELNGLGARPIVKWGALPLDSADLQANTPARLVYDGERFLLISSSYLNCPPGLVPVTKAYCITPLPMNTDATFFDACTTCAELGGRLCTMSEWATACRLFPDFLSTVTTFEWVDHGANNQRDAKVVGAGWNGNVTVEGTGCEYGRSRVPETVIPYRCCFSR